MRNVTHKPKGFWGMPTMRSVWVFGITSAFNVKSRSAVRVCAGVLALAASSIAQDITSVSPSTIPQGGPAQTVKAYGSWTSGDVNKTVDICVGSDPMPKTLSILPEAGGKYYVDVVMVADELKNPGLIAIRIATSSTCAQLPPGAKAKGVLVVSSAIRESAGPAELLLGVDVSAASSASPGANFLGLGVFDLPLFGDGNIRTSGGGTWWISGQLGLKGMAQPGAVSGAASAGYYSSIVNATPDKIVQSVDASVHVGLEIKNWNIASEMFASDEPDPSLNQEKEGTWATFSVIFGGGAVTPLSASQSGLQVFEANASLLTAFPYTGPPSPLPPSCYPPTTPFNANSCYVVFIPQDRTHFYRSFDAGFRLKLYGADYNHKRLRFPAILDLTVGDNEYVTGGTFHGPVLHLGGSFPFPRVDYIYVFGSIDLALTGANGGGQGQQILLVPAPVTAGVSATSPTVYPIYTTQPFRDRYEFGFGVDIFHLFASKFNSDKKTD